MFDDDADPFGPPPDNFVGSEEDSVVEIEAWFVENFEEDAESLAAHEVWGGPYKTRDIIENVFADIASPSLIDAACRRMDSFGLLWMPRMRRRTYSETVYEKTETAVLHEQMLEEIQGFERVANGLFQVARHGIGHNRPPEPMETMLDDTDARQISNALATLKQQPIMPASPDPALRAVEILTSKRQKVMAWLAKQGEAFAGEAVKEAGKKFGKWAPRAFWLVVVDKLLGVSNAVLSWLNSLY